MGVVLAYRGRLSHAAAKPILGAPVKFGTPIDVVQIRTVSTGNRGARSCAARRRRRRDVRVGVAQQSARMAATTMAATLSAFTKTSS